MNKNEVIELIKATGVFPVVRADSAEEARRVVETVKRGGINIVEITMTVPNALEVIREISAPDVLIGAGTVLDAETARACILAGAKFIVSPALNTATIACCRRYGVCVMPGALTPTEIVKAWTAGADFVKIFPAGALGGASYLKSIKAPLPQIELIPTGGVSLNTAADFIRAGASAIGVGADLADVDELRRGNGELISERARQFLQIVKTAREQSVQ